MSPQTVGRYEILDELGRGAMGVVYKAADPNIGRTVALKTMRLDVHGLESKDVLLRFKNEARAVGVLNHPNIVTIFDAGEHEGTFYIAMEFIEGRTLQALLQERRVLSGEEVVRLARQICQGLDYAHATGIVHRDIKPANIMITPQGNAKIMDFGIAKSGGGMTSTGQVLGTPNYMSPEQVKGKSLDGRSDLFSLGVILYEMVTGEKPFTGENVTTIIYKIVNENPIAPRELDVSVHPGLSAVVIKALAKLPEERYQSGAALARDLENYKAIGSNLDATTVYAPTRADKTVALNPEKMGSGTVRMAAVARPPAARVVPPAPPKKKNTMLAAVLTLLVLGSAISGYAFLRARNKQRQLAAQAKIEEARRQAQPAAVASSEPKPADAAAQPGSAPGADSAKTAVDNSGKPQASAVSSPNQVLTNPAELRFTSKPDGAKVEIDGWSEPGWKTPFVASNLAAGPHVIVISKKGYVQETLRARAVAGKSFPVHTELNEEMALIAVSSSPVGAGILLDGQDTGKVTPAQFSVPRGLHKVTVRKAGYKEASKQEDLAVAQSLNFSPVLQAQSPVMDNSGQGGILRRMIGAETIPDGKGIVHIRTVPEGATIIVNGRTAPKKTNVRWPTDPGTYDITLQMDGYKTVHRTVRVQLNKVSNVDELLQKRP
ncbi:MAG TPA: serine/threonine-protein kinase [Alphaproteobacteria bacterium]|nr:serine/threonine-protein kinase [Alphaproteobacteria bacterium]